MTIKIKILLLMTSVAILVAVPAGYMFFTFIKDIFYQNEIQNRMNEVRKMAVVVADNLEANDYIPIINYINKMKSLDPTLREISIVNLNNQIVSHTDPSYIGKKYKEKLFVNRDIIAWSMNINSKLKGRFLGIIKVEYDKDTIYNSIAKHIKDSGRKTIIIALSAFMVGIIPGLWFSYNISKPLQNLARACSKVSAGNLEIKLEVKGSDEVAIVTKEVKSMVEKLRELDQMKDDFVNNVSHELKSPLASIKSYIEILQNGSFGSLTAKQLEFIEIIKRATVRLSVFINNVLDIAKIKAGKFNLDLRKTNLYDIISDVLQLYQPIFIEKRIEYIFNGKRDEFFLVCDEESIKRVVINLLSNALKFTPEYGKISINLNIENGFLRCSIADTGPGIHPDNIKRLFNRFEQIEVSGEKKKSGTGLGLFISRDIIEKHNGKLWVESVLGKGSNFIFILPNK